MIHMTGCIIAIHVHVFWQHNGHAWTAWNISLWQKYPLSKDRAAEYLLVVAVPAACMQWHGSCRARNTVARNTESLASGTMATKSLSGGQLGLYLQSVYSSTRKNA
jgi:hypothetical protein